MGPMGLRVHPGVLAKRVRGGRLVRMVQTVLPVMRVVRAPPVPLATRVKRDRKEGMVLSVRVVKQVQEVPVEVMEVLANRETLVQRGGLDPRDPRGSLEAQDRWAPAAPLGLKETLVL